MTFFKIGEGHDLYRDEELDYWIFQPDLDDIQFNPNRINKDFNVACRVIWNKIIRKKILIKSIQYIGKKYYNKYFITAEDTILNLISFHFAKNFSNIEIIGYM